MAKKDYIDTLKTGIDFVGKMAAKGVRFHRAYAQSSYTLPSHASLFTSLYPGAHGLHSGSDVVPASVDFLAEILARNGWTTASFNGGNFVSHEFGFHRGFDLYCEVDPLGDRYLDGAPYNDNRLADGSRGSLAAHGAAPRRSSPPPASVAFGRLGPPWRQYCLTHGRPVRYTCP